MRLPEIRKLLGGVTQAELGAHIGVSQGSVSFYENGQAVPPLVAAKLIEFARSKGVDITFDDIYAPLVEGREQAAA